MRTFSGLFKEWANGRSANSIAGRLGVAPNTVANWLKGKSLPPDTKVAWLSYLTQIPPWEITEGLQAERLKLQSRARVDAASKAQRRMKLAADRKAERLARRQEKKRVAVEADASRQLNPREVGERYRLRKENVMRLCRSGRLPCVRRKTRGGKRGFFIDPADAARVLGSK